MNPAYRTILTTPGSPVSFCGEGSTAADATRAAFERAQLTLGYATPPLAEFQAIHQCTRSARAA